MEEVSWVHCEDHVLSGSCRRWRWLQADADRERFSQHKADTQLIQTFTCTTGAVLLRLHVHFPQCCSPDAYYKSSGNIALSLRRNIRSFWLSCQREGRGKKLFVVHGVNFFSLPPWPSQKRPQNFQVLGTAGEGRHCFLDKQSTIQQLISKSII